MLRKLDDAVRNINYRPLVMSQRQIFEILQDSRFDQIGFYAVNLESPNLQPPIVTLSYVLFDSNLTPYQLDGSANSQTDISYYLTQVGFKIDPAGQTSFIFNRTDVLEIFNTTTDTDFEHPDAKQFVVFILADNSLTYPAVVDTVLKIDLFYEVIKTWVVGGGGPAAGSRRPAPVVQPVVPGQP
jgi:hypothetical protein